jgi:hypothetical protein
MRYRHCLFVIAVFILGYCLLEYAELWWNSRWVIKLPDAVKAAP